LVGYVALHAVESISVITATRNGKAIVTKGKQKLMLLLVGIACIDRAVFLSPEGRRRL